MAERTATAATRSNERYAPKGKAQMARERAGAGAKSNGTRALLIKNGLLLSNSFGVLWHCVLLRPQIKHNMRYIIMGLLLSRTVNASDALCTHVSANVLCAHAACRWINRIVIAFALCFVCEYSRPR
jgi:hypothetical protein